MDRKRILAAVLAATALTASAATAGVTSFLTDIVSPNSSLAGFLGTWAYGDLGPGDIDHVIVSEGGASSVRIQVFGRCENVVCNWGVQNARVRTTRPDSDEVRSLAADFNLGYALRHLTLHKAPGGLLAYEVVTEFTDGSDRHDYENVGRLLPPGAVPTAAVPSPVPEASAVSPAPSPAEAAYANSPSTASAGGEEDCIQFNGKKAYVADDGNGNWQVRDFLHPVLKLGPNRNAALAAMRIVANYHFDEVCYIGHGAGQMTYWRMAGEFARTPMPGQDCIDVDPTKVKAVQRDDSWKVMNGEQELFDYGDDQANAQQAAQMIRSYRLNRQCFFARPDSRTSYWLAP